MKIPQFKYDYKHGPLKKNELIKNKIKSGNCRLAIQLFFFYNFNTYLAPEKILLPQAFYQTGNFVFKENEPIDFSLLKQGDIIYAEQIKNKSLKIIDKSKGKYQNFDDYLFNLHTAIYLDNQKIYHATYIEGKSCVWSLKKFFTYYKIIAVKRLKLRDENKI